MLDFSFIHGLALGILAEDAIVETEEGDIEARSSIQFYFLCFRFTVVF